MKMKKFLLLMFALLYVSTTKAQTNSNRQNIKKEIEQLFFYIPIQADKYEIRKELHLNNSNYKDELEYQDNCNCFITDFFKQPLLKNIGDNPTVVIWLDDSGNRSYLRKITFDYYSKDFPNCDKQLNDLFELFAPLSYKNNKIAITNGGKKNGEGYYFYSNKSNYNNKKEYLTIHYRYIDLSNVSSKSKYIFEIIIHEKNI